MLTSAQFRRLYRTSIAGANGRCQTGIEGNQVRNDGDSLNAASQFRVVGISEIK